MIPTYPQLAAQVARRLAKGQTPTRLNEQEAFWIIDHVLSSSQRPNPYGIVPNELSSAQLDHIETIVEQRVEEDKPLAYILGHVPFLDFDIEVEPPILIPRMETEEWCMRLLELLEPHKSKSLKILDLCTGSGCIALGLAGALPHSQVTGIDIDPQAVELANRNKNNLGLTNVDFSVSDLFSGLGSEARFDLIVSNPPYVTEQEWAELEPGVKNWESRRALVADNDGLELYDKIAQQLTTRLNRETFGWCVFEIGHEQADAVSSLLAGNGLEVFESWTDSFGKPRAIFSRL